MILSRRSLLALSPALAAGQRAFTPERVEALTAPARPTLILSHAGFLPNSKKTVILRAPSTPPPAEFTLHDIADSRAFPPQRRPLRPVTTDFGPHLSGDFSDITRPGMYQVRIGDPARPLRSIPFFIRADAWSRILPKALNYIRQQRCGTEVPGIHPVCHLDDARRRDNGAYIDMTGGWHDAGDLRKWMSATMMSGFALMHLARRRGARPALLDEMRWGNRYFLKMQDADGKVFNDTAGGLNGDNSDNHWTDNRRGTPDDRYINPAKPPLIQAEFTALQALVANVFQASDPSYAQLCQAAAERCWRAATSPQPAHTLEAAWWLLAALELHRSTGAVVYRDTATALAAQLVARQETAYVANQTTVRGYFRTSSSDDAPFVHATESALPAIALLEAADAMPGEPAAARWKDAVRLHLEGYVAPLTARSVYRIMPYGIFRGAPTPEKYRPLAGELTFRYFLPTRKQSWWLGTTSHLENYAALLTQAAAVFSEPSWRELALRQLEWVFGANPFDACLMTGEGLNNPYPHSRFVGLLVGGIMNGIAGNPDDEPILDQENGYDWRTTEYWSPHNAWFIWTLALL